ncbi:MAG: uracil-DNA glycosylase [Candidatus Thermoplasmatota archaeon]
MKCRLSEIRIHALCGEGNLNAKLMLIAQAPGENEDRKGIMFIGPSGKVLDELLQISAVDREELYMTNLVKCMLPKNRKPKQDEIDMCSHYLDEEIELINPEIMVPLGYYATTYVFKKYDLPVPSKQKFYTVYGMLFLSGKRKILPLQRPAAVCHNTSLKEVLVKNYHKLKVLSKDCKLYQVCPMKRYYEEGKLDRKWVELYCKGDWESCVRYKIEMNGEWHVDWMLPDGTLEGGLEGV